MFICERFFHAVRGSPRDLNVFDETVSTMKLTWQAAPGNVLQYIIAYKPAEGGERKEITVKGDTTRAALKNLQPATEYELFVSARYSSGVGDPILGTGTTLEGMGRNITLSLSRVWIENFKHGSNCNCCGVQLLFKWQEPLGFRVGCVDRPADLVLIITLVSIVQICAVISHTPPQEKAPWQSTLFSHLF